MRQSDILQIEKNKQCNKDKRCQRVRIKIIFSGD